MRRGFVAALAVGVWCLGSPSARGDEITFGELDPAAVTVTFDTSGGVLDGGEIATGVHLRSGPAVMPPTRARFRSTA
jgi:hypothetical protein